MKKLLILSITILSGLLFLSCDSSTSSNENNNDENPSVDILRAVLYNEGDADATINYSVLVTEVTGEETHSANMTVGAGNSVPSILAESEPGATAITAEVEIVTGGPVRLAIEKGIMVDGSFEGEELMSVPGGSGQTISLTYEGN